MPGPLLLFAFIHFIITRPAPAPNRMNMHANLEYFNLFDDCVHAWIRDIHVGTACMCARRYVRACVLSYSHEDLVPEVALGGGGGGGLSSTRGVQAEPGVVGEGRHGGVGGRETVGGRRRPSAMLLLLLRRRCRRHRYRGRPPRRGGRRPRAVGSRVLHVAPPGGGRRRRLGRRGAGDGGLRALLRHALHARQLVRCSAA